MPVNILICGGTYQIHDAGEIVATARVEDIAEGKAIIQYIYCKDGFENKGLEEALLRTIMQEADRNKVSLYLTLQQSNLEKIITLRELLANNNFGELYSSITYIRTPKS